MTKCFSFLPILVLLEDLDMALKICFIKNSFEKKKKKDFAVILYDPYVRWPFTTLRTDTDLFLNVTLRLLGIIV